MSILASAPSTPTTDPTAEALAPMVEMWLGILAVHVPDADAHCRGCTDPGTGARRTPWPCAVRIVAVAARQVHASRAASAEKAVGRRRAPRLTSRERQFLQLAVEGCTDADIAERLDVPARTVATLIRRVTYQVGARHRAELLLHAVRSGAIT